MGRLSEIVLVAAIFCVSHVSAYSLNGMLSMANDELSKRTVDSQAAANINLEGTLNFTLTPIYNIDNPRVIPCLFVFDKEASADLNNNPDNGQLFATKLAALASRYMAHAHITVINAGTEMWINNDQIAFTFGTDPTMAMPAFLTQFQAYLATKKALFGTKYAVGVLLSNKSLVQGGYSQGPPCITDGASLINYRKYPWTIGGLLAHELAHTLSVVHPWELPYVCPGFPSVKFCASSILPDACMCDTAAYPPEQCLMTYMFGRAQPNAATYTPCDIEMMNHFSGSIGCIKQS